MPFEYGCIVDWRTPDGPSVGGALFCLPKHAGLVQRRRQALTKHRQRQYTNKVLERGMPPPAQERRTDAYEERTRIVWQHGV